GEAQGAETDDDVVADGDHRRDPAAQIEPEREIDGDPHEAGQHEVDGLQLELPADLGADELDPPDLELAEGGPGTERALDAAGDFFRAHRLDQRQPDDVLAVVAELLDDALAQLNRGEARPDLGDRGHLLESHLDQGAAGEVEVVAQPAPDGERAEADQGEGDRDDIGPLPLADEVVVRTPKELDHIEIVSTFRRPM